jgi:CO/xanthine dehydrogenase Mo-binding subunit
MAFGLANAVFNATGVRLRRILYPGTGVDGLQGSK